MGCVKRHKVGVFQRSSMNKFVPIASAPGSRRVPMNKRTKSDIVEDMCMKAEELITFYGRMTSYCVTRDR